MAILDNIVSYWKLDESSGNASDSVSSNTLTNNNTVGYATGKINNGADFGTTNSNKYFRISSSMSMAGSTNYSVSLWVKIRTEPTSGSYQIFSDFLVGTGSSQARLQIFYQESGGNRYVYFRRGNASTDSTVTYTGSLGTSAWHHLVLTYDGTDLKGYVDGSYVNSASSSGVGGYGITNNYTVGGSIDNTPNGLSNAYIDEIGVWSRGLSSTEVTLLYNSNAGIQYPFLLGPANLKSYNTNLKANIKSINTNLIANVKSLNTNV